MTQDSVKKVVQDVYDSGYLAGAKAAISILRSAVNGTPENKYTALVAELVKIVEDDFIRHLETGPPPNTHEGTTQ